MSLASSREVRAARFASAREQRHEAEAAAARQQYHPIEFQQHEQQQPPASHSARPPTMSPSHVAPTHHSTSAGVMASGGDGSHGKEIDEIGKTMIENALAQTQFDLKRYATLKECGMGSCVLLCAIHDSFNTASPDSAAVRAATSPSPTLCTAKVWSFNSSMLAAC